MADYETLYPGRFLKKEALAAPKTIRIVDVIATNLEGEKGVEPKVVLKYRDKGGEGEIVWCKTNAILTFYVFNERDYDKWKGRLITIYNNPNVDLKGKKVGGIRVYGSPEMTSPMKVEIKRPRRKTPEVYNLVPTGKNAAKASEPPKPAPSPVEEPEAPSDVDFDDAPSAEESVA